MISVRPLNESDRPLLEESIAKDEWHRGMDANGFFDKRAISTVFENEKPVMFVKGSPVLRLDIQWVSNDNKKNNAEALHRLSQIIDTAKSSGFMELVFNTDSSLLKEFCCKHFGFVEVIGELRRYL